jgi:hypothetical protein
VGRSERNRSLGISRGTMEDNSKANLQDVGWKVTDWTDLFLAEDKRRALVNGVMKFWVPLYAGNFLTSLGPVSFSGMTLVHGVG